MGRGRGKGRRAKVKVERAKVEGVNNNDYDRGIRDGGQEAEVTYSFENVSLFSLLYSIKLTGNPGCKGQKD